MKKASSSFLLVILAALFVTLQSYAQISTAPTRPGRGNPGPTPLPRPLPGPVQNRILQEQVNLALRPFERIGLTSLLRVSRQEQVELEVLSLRIEAQALQVQAMLEVSQRGRVISSQPLRRSLGEVLIIVPVGTPLSELELSASSDAYISVITAEVQSMGRPFPGPAYDQQVTPNSLLNLRVNQQVRGYASIPLDQLVRSQLGLSLEGAQIERVVVDGFSSSYGRAATVQVELNRIHASDIKYLDQGRMVPLPLLSFEEVRSSLSLIVNGDAQIQNVRIRIGQVRSRSPEIPRTERVLVQREILPQLGLSLAELLGYDSRLIRSITIDGRATRQFQAIISLLSSYGDLQGSAVLGNAPTKATIILRRPMTAREIRLDSSERALINSLEIEFQSYSRY